jgi:hypothetical protein
VPSQVPSYVGSRFSLIFLHLFLFFFQIASYPSLQNMALGYGSTFAPTAAAPTSSPMPGSAKQSKTSVELCGGYN